MTGPEPPSHRSDRDHRDDSQDLLSGDFRAPLPFALIRRPLPEVNDSIPPCAVTVDGRRAHIRPSAPSDTVADLAGAVDADPAGGLWLDGVHAGPAETLVAAGLLPVTWLGRMEARKWLV